VLEIIIISDSFECTYNHRGTPEHNDGRQEPPRANLSEDNGRGRLEEYIGYEKYQGNQIVSVVDSQFEVDGHAARMLAEASNLSWCR
jgi:hypothetical protein